MKYVILSFLAVLFLAVPVFAAQHEANTKGSAQEKTEFKSETASAIWENQQVLEVRKKYNIDVSFPFETAKMVNGLLNGLKRYFYLSYHLIQPSLQSFLTAVLTASIVWNFFSIVYGSRGDAHLKSIGTTLLLAMMAVGIVLNYEALNYIVFTLMIKLPLGIAGSLVTLKPGGTLAQLFGDLDKNIGLILGYAGAMVDGLGWTDILVFLKNAAIALIFIALYFACYLMYLGLVLTSVFILGVLGIMAPFTIFFVAPQETRHIFVAWVKAVATNALTPIIASIIMAVFIAVVDIFMVDYLKTFSKSSSFFSPELLYVLVCCGIAFLALQSTPQIVSSVTGGRPMSTGAMAGMAMAGGFGMAAGKVLGASKMAGGKAVLLGRKFASQGAQGSKTYKAYSAMKGAFDTGKRPDGTRRWQPLRQDKPAQAARMAEEARRESRNEEIYRQRQAERQAEREAARKK